MEKTNTLWYTRKNGTVKGPFTSAAIANDLILDRLSMDDEVSHDEINWQVLLQHSELHCKLRGAELKKAKIYLDERNGFDQRDSQKSRPQYAKIRKGERRSIESDINIQRRQFHTNLILKLRQQHHHLFWPLIAILLALALITFFAIKSPQEIPTPLADCHSPALSYVNWSNCHKPNLIMKNKDLSHAKLTNSHLIYSDFSQSNLSNADLTYANLQSSNLSNAQLQNSNLMGANLKNANLSYSNLSNANLSYANLTGVNLMSSQIDNVRFDHAIWTTGQRCAPQSIGKCIIR